MAQNFIDYCPNDFRVYPYDIAAQLVCQPATTRASTSNCVDVGEIVHMGIHKSPLGLPPWVMHLLSITTWQEDSFGVLVTQVCSVLYYWLRRGVYKFFSATTVYYSRLLLDGAHMIYGLASYVSLLCQDKSWPSLMNIVFFKIQGELGSSVAITDDGYKKAKKKKNCRNYLKKKNL